jgi:positive regulator of sigma E activity
VRTPDASVCLAVEATVRGNAEHGFDLEAERPRCSGCAGTCMFSWTGQPLASRVPLDVSVRAGDRVRLSLPVDRLLAGSMWLHGLPLAALLIGGGLGALATRSDLGCLLGVLVGIGSLVVLAPVFRRRIERVAGGGIVVERLGPTGSSPP